MTTLQQRQLAFLEDTAKHFNSTNLCTTGSTCKYYWEGFDGCAIGRHIKDKDLCRQLDLARGGSGVSNFEVFILLPEELKELGQGFLSKVQSLHDCRENWDGNGLTQSGREAADEIKREFSL